MEGVQGNLLGLVDALSMPSVCPVGQIIIYPNRYGNSY